MQAPELSVHEHTYHRFMLAVKWFAAHLAVAIVLLTLWFATPVGFWGALLVAAIVWGVIVFAMNHGLNHSSEPHLSEHPDDIPRHA